MPHADVIALAHAPRRILIVRLSAIGDIVMSSPFASALKQRYPEAQISWLTQPENAALLEHHPAVDQVLRWPKGEWQTWWRDKQYRRVWHAFKDLRQQLREQDFDLAIDLQGLMKSAVWAYVSGASTRIGLGAKEGAQWLMTLRAERHGQAAIIASEYRALAQQLGLLADDDYPWSMGLSEADRQQAQALLAEAQVPAEYGVICPFTTRPQKHWLDERWGPVVEGLQKPMVMLGGPADVARGQQIARDRQAPSLYNLTGRSSLRVAAAIIQRAQLLIGVDTGLTHMGIALGRPTLGLFGATRPYLHTGRQNARILYSARECSPCRRSPSCNARFDCMRDLPVAEVQRAAQQLWGGPA